jgi:hypothetical protein
MPMPVSHRPTHTLPATAPCIPLYTAATIFLRRVPEERWPLPLRRRCALAAALHHTVTAHPRTPDASDPDLGIPIIHYYPIADCEAPALTTYYRLAEFQVLSKQ